MFLHFWGIGNGVKKWFFTKITVWSYVSYVNWWFGINFEAISFETCGKNDHFQNRTWGKIFSTSCTVLKVLFFSTRLQGNGLRGGPKVPIYVWNVSPISLFRWSGRKYIKMHMKITTQSKKREIVEISNSHIVTLGPLSPSPHHRMWVVCQDLGSRDNLLSSFRSRKVKKC